MADKGSFVLYAGWLEQLEMLDMEQRGIFITNVFRHAAGDELEPMDLATNLFFSLVRAQLQRDSAKWETVRRARSEAGRAGGLARASKSGQEQANASNAQHNEAKQAVSVSVSGSVSGSVDETVTVTPPTRSADFEVFWSAYPKKVGKQAAKEAFEKVNVPVESLVTAIKRQECSPQWSKDGGQYIPNPATWLNQGRWEDEPGTGQSTGTEAFQSVSGVVYC